VIPSFSIATIFDFLGQIAAASNINLRVLHGEQELIFHRPIPRRELHHHRKVSHYYDKGPKGALVIGESETCDAGGKKLFTNIITLFGRLDGGFGGEDALKRMSFPGSDPDFVVTAFLSGSALLYRLSAMSFSFTLILSLPEW